MKKIFENVFRKFFFPFPRVRAFIAMISFYFRKFPTGWRKSSSRLTYVLFCESQFALFAFFKWCTSIFAGGQMPVSNNNLVFLMSEFRWKLKFIDFWNSHSLICFHCSYSERFWRTDSHCLSILSVGTGTEKFRSLHFKNPFPYLISFWRCYFPRALFFCFPCYPSAVENIHRIHTHRVCCSKGISFPIAKSTFQFDFHLTSIELWSKPYSQHDWTFSWTWIMFISSNVLPTKGYLLVIIKTTLYVLPRSPGNWNHLFCLPFIVYPYPSICLSSN